MVTDDLLMYLLVQLSILVTLNKGRIYQYLGKNVYYIIKIFVRTLIKVWGIKNHDYFRIVWIYFLVYNIRNWRFVQYHSEYRRNYMLNL